MIHKALLGSIERFLAVYIEHTAGKFPLWLSPVQVKILPIADRHTEVARHIHLTLQKEGIRSEMDDRSERLQAKIRDATLQKVPLMGIIGDKEVSEGQNKQHTLSVRTRDGNNLGHVDVETFINDVKKQIDKKIS